METHKNENKKIMILHLYHDLMNLYGDWANPVVLARELSARGREAELGKKSVGDKIEFSLYDFIYIGSGTERSQIACMRDLAQYKNTLIERIEAGIPVLATGNSHEMFGQAVTDSDAVRHEMLGLLEFETVQLNTRVTGDCICTASLSFGETPDRSRNDTIFLKDKLIGFINRAGGNQKGDTERPFFIEPGEGASYKACTEGIRYKNLLGTYMTGPLLVRNPPLLRYFADILTGEATEGNLHTSSADPFFKHQEKAYNLALGELSGRVK